MGRRVEHVPAWSMLGFLSKSCKEGNVIQKTVGSKKESSNLKTEAGYRME